jgi:hypothetical protein
MPTPDIEVLRTFVKEFSPIHQTEADNMSYEELWAVVKECVESHEDK